MSKPTDSTPKPNAAPKRQRRKRAATDTASELAHGQLEVDDLNYAPAIAAIDDLFTWAIDLAMQSVADWPAGKRRVKSARRYLRSLMRGKVPQGPNADEDVAFTAALLVRIFDAELGLGLGAIAEIFAELGMTHEHVPSVPPTPSVSAAPSFSAATLRHLRAIYAALTPAEADAAHIEAMTLSPAERARWADGLSRLPVPAAVALVRSYLFGPHTQATSRPLAPPPPRVMPLRRSVESRFVAGPLCPSCPFRVAA